MAVGWNRRNTSVLKLSFMKFLPNKGSGEHAIKQVAQDPVKHLFHILLMAQKKRKKKSISKQQKYVTLHGKNMDVANAILHEATKYTHKNLFYILIKSNTSNKGRISQRKMKSDLFCNLFSSSTVKPLLPLKRQMSMY